jgi:hypothetical protein
VLQAKKDQSNVFKDKGAGMRKVAKKMRDAAASMEAEMVDVRKEDETLRTFDIPFTKLNDHGPLITIGKVSIRHPDTGEMVAVRDNFHASFLAFILSCGQGVGLSWCDDVGCHRLPHCHQSVTSVSHTADTANPGIHPAHHQRCR